MPGAIGWSAAKKFAVAGVTFLAASAVLLSVFALLSGTATKKPCPTGWHERIRRCFKFTEPLIFLDAVERCKQLGGQPASVRSAAEDKALFDLSRKELGQTGRYYIGLYLPQRLKSHHFWLDGTDYLYQNWDQGEEPSDVTQKCTEVTLATEGRWRKVVCYHEQPLLCAKPARNL